MPTKSVTSVLTGDKRDDFDEILKAPNSLFQKVSRTYNPTKAELGAAFEVPLVLEVSLYYSPTVAEDPDFLVFSVQNQDEENSISTIVKQYDGGGTLARDQYEKLASALTSFGFVLNEVFSDAETRKEIEAAQNPTPESSPIEDTPTEQPAQDTTVQNQIPTPAEISADTTFVPGQTVNPALVNSTPTENTNSTIAPVEVPVVASLPTPTETSIA